MRPRAAATEKRYAPARAWRPAPAGGHRAGIRRQRLRRRARGTTSRTSRAHVRQNANQTVSVSSRAEIVVAVLRVFAGHAPSDRRRAVSDVASAHLRSTSRASHSSRHESTVSMTSPRMSISRSSCCTIKAPTAAPATSFPESRFSFAFGFESGADFLQRPPSVARLSGPASARRRRASALLALVVLPRNTVSRSLCTAARSTPSEKDSERSRVKSSASTNETHRAGKPSRPARPACWMYASGDRGGGS